MFFALTHGSINPSDMRGSHHHVTLLKEILAVFFLLATAMQNAIAEDFAGLMPFQPGSCSNKCQNQHGDSIISSQPSSQLLFKCSCSSSCVLYGDCCYDSPFRKKSNFTKPQETVCLTLSGRGSFEAVATCPKHWWGSSEFCGESIGHLPPVTSLKTGITYANFHCALCNFDPNGLTTWRVDLECCPEHQASFLESRYLFSQKNLWQVLDTDATGLQQMCFCRYVAKRGARKFANHLELRRCDAKSEISTCSRFWKDDTVRDLCKSYIDPVYLRDRVYRNMHCAQCNYESVQDSLCRPKIVDEIFKDGAKYEVVRQYCKDKGLRSCVHYLRNRNKGAMQAFSNMFKLVEIGCLPPEGRRCCDGERYDYRHKKCRKLN